MRLYAIILDTEYGNLIQEIALKPEDLNVKYISGNSPYLYELTHDIYTTELKDCVNVDDWELYKEGNQVCCNATLIRNKMAKK